MKWLRLYYVRGNTTGADGTGSRWESPARYKEKRHAEQELAERIDRGAGSVSGSIMVETFRLHEYPFMVIPDEYGELLQEMQNNP